MGSNDHLAPRKGRTAPTSKPARPTSSSGWQGFINVSLTDSIKKKWLEWANTGAQFFDALTRLTDNGYKVTVKAEPQHSCYSAFITHTDPTHPDFGWGLSERAGDPYTALNRAVYLHEVVLAGDWDSYKQSSGWTDRWA